MKKLTNRGIHRDVAYFYFGLIVAFSFSGIILNHRQDWYPMDYSYDSQPIALETPTDQNELTEDYLRSVTGEIGEYDGHRVRDGQLRVYFEDNIILDADMATGKGTVEYKRKVPLIGHTMFLHKSTNSFWIWYSDIFGAAMLLIAFTGILISTGNNSFRKRGWKLAVAGMLFPLLFLVLFA